PLERQEERFVRYGRVAYPMVSAPYVARDTLFLPLQWLTDCVPRLLAGRYRWDPWLARLDEITVAATVPPPVPSAPPPPPPPPPPPAAPTTRAPNPMTGLRLPHTIVVDPGHGGVIPAIPASIFRAV